MGAPEFSRASEGVAVAVLAADCVGPCLREVAFSLGVRGYRQNAGRVADRGVLSPDHRMRLLDTLKYYVSGGTDRYLFTPSSAHPHLIWIQSPILGVLTVLSKQNN